MPNYTNIYIYIYTHIHHDHIVLKIAARYTIRGCVPCLLPGKLHPSDASLSASWGDHSGAPKALQYYVCGVMLEGFQGVHQLGAPLCRETSVSRQLYVSDGWICSTLASHAISCFTLIYTYIYIFHIYIYTYMYIYIHMYIILNIISSVKSYGWYNAFLC